MNKHKNTIELSAQISTLSHDGRGIASIQQKKTFIQGALPGETVTYKIMQKSSHYNTGQVIDVLQQAQERVQPPCQHFGLCGGCSLQHMDMQLQLQLKQQTLLDHLKH